MSWRIAEHTADLAIEAEGPSAAAVLEDAGLALTSVLTGHDDVHALGPPDESVAFRVEAPDKEALAVAFLAELLWLLESKDTLWLGGGVEVDEGENWRAKGHGNGVRFDRKRHGQGVEVKAVTYHDLHFGPGDGGWKLRVVLDI